MAKPNSFTHSSNIPDHNKKKHLLILVCLTSTNSPFFT
uniref:Uncharacterized protein n=1 Tax=Medicago truncatula TaxID=3880 RepID=I3S2Z5_MEDTR|nr:unknown [Medicago truncatula]